MEQQLINALVKLFAKAGGGSLIKDLIQQVDQNRNPKVWTPAEISSAIDFINTKTESYGQAEAKMMIDSLQKKFNVGLDISLRDRNSPAQQDVLPETPGVHGLV